ncbi:sulfurtransferase [Alkalicoccus luteus]|uniref:Sulfurtransferase n=1 Tax=Alkalicoccus luteus TaxID=1237094 RepID=A0A969PMT1_9BACI|nr:sulfurtransferase [Alkalicoccus luteus]NJP37076.1 sulfurtransferase [Alkalicoccus luteus]
MTFYHPIVTTDWLLEHLDDDNVRILDASVLAEETPDEFRIHPGADAYQEEHIPGAFFADLLTVFSDTKASVPLTAVSHETFVTLARGLGIHDDTTVVIYDRGPLVNASFTASDWASRLWWQFRLAGHEDVYVLAGGLPQWKKQAGPLTDEIPLAAAGTFTGSHRPELLADINDVRRAMHDDQTVIMNCLSLEDFRGESGRYPRKGHIPGSTHVFFGDLSREDGTLPLPERLHEQFRESGVLDADKRVITYCGGGVAATWNALVLTSLGREPAVYDGSLMEWTSDDANPLTLPEDS